MSLARRSAAVVAALGLAVATAPGAAALPSTDSLMPPSAGCSVDVDRLADQTPAPANHPGWSAEQTANVCGNLGYVFLETKGGTGSSPTKVVLFHRGEPVATQPAANARVLLGGTSDFHVALRVQQPPAAGEPNAAAGYLTTVYAWNPFIADASPIGPLPAGINI